MPRFTPINRPAGYIPGQSAHPEPSAPTAAAPADPVPAPVPPEQAEAANILLAMSRSMAQPAPAAAPSAPAAIQPLPERHPLPGHGGVPLPTPGAAGHRPGQTKTEREKIRAREIMVDGKRAAVPCKRCSERMSLRYNGDPTLVDRNRDPFLPCTMPADGNLKTCALCKSLKEKCVEDDRLVGRGSS
ncbi:hypothetical protein B0T16DRAFT_452582 [Cercophora newfieldiana]|uniref:Uncharacterized protein n=1 Tax=Cercophora newfieldiana TaxID=92897 RepID=A0AA39YR23_9PEZI|nr:hypothetical protein B0T16DRAFT_452582 [Cercophora newfieldiana]